jgi:methyl-accepting chemotaxis protein
MLVYISLALLAVGCVLLACVARELGEQVRVLTAEMRAAEALLKCAHENDVEFDQRITDDRKNQREFNKMTDDRIENIEKAMKSLRKAVEGYNVTVIGAVRDVQKRVAVMEETMAAAEDLIKEHAELEREAANSEKLFQEGLANILSYGVVKNE